MWVGQWVGSEYSPGGRVELDIVHQLTNLYIFREF